jgi:hypothetical protein
MKIFQTNIDQFDQRWKIFMTNLHYVGAFFNPYLLGETHLHDDANVKEALNRVLQKGVIIVKRAKNHIKKRKNCQFFQTFLCNDTLMSC